MPQDIRLWSIADGASLIELPKSPLNLESRLEDWLARDISILGDLLVIGRQVSTAYGGYIDLLCLNRDGDLVIMELKRDKTPREITAQVLDYASWAKDLSNNEITAFADAYLGSDGPLDAAFQRQFKIGLPEVLNERHSMLIIGSAIDSSSERIIKYLSDTYGVGINALTFQYFTDGAGREYLSRVFLLAPGDVAENARHKGVSKREPRLTYEELQEAAEEKGVGTLYVRLVERMRQVFDRSVTTRSSVAFIGDPYNRIFSLIPTDSSIEQGLKFQVYLTRFMGYFHLDEPTALSLLPADRSPWSYWQGAPPEWSGYQGWFGDEAEVEKFLSGITG